MTVRQLGLAFLLAALGFVASPALADKHEGTPEEGYELPGEISATLAFATDYVYRGISQTSEDVAWQSSMDWTHEAGVYLGAWSSNVDFKDGSSQIEIDLYGGYQNSYEGIDYDVMILGYLYPGADRDLDQEFVEFSFTVGHDFEVVSASVGVAVSPDFYGGSGVGTHISTGIGIPIPLDLLTRYNVAVDGNFGYQDISDGGSYVHWSAGIAAEVLGFGLDVRYLGNDVDSRAAADDDRAVFTISRSF